MPRWRCPTNPYEASASRTRRGDGRASLPGGRAARRFIASDGHDAPAPRVQTSQVVLTGAFARASVRAGGGVARKAGVGDVGVRTAVHPAPLDQEVGHSGRALLVPIERDVGTSVERLAAGVSRIRVPIFASVFCYAPLSRVSPPSAVDGRSRIRRVGVARLGIGRVRASIARRPGLRAAGRQDHEQRRRRARGDRDGDGSSARRLPGPALGFEANHRQAVSFTESPCQLGAVHRVGPNRSDRGPIRSDERVLSSKDSGTLARGTSVARRSHGVDVVRRA
jgi:hypothetical protein